MRGGSQQARGWDDEGEYGAADDYYGDDEYAEGTDDWDDQADDRGLVLQSEQSLVGVSNTVTHHGVPLLSYTRTMNRFYTNRKQKLSLGYERLAWTWTNLYAQQQRLAAQGQFE